MADLSPPSGIRRRRGPGDGMDDQQPLGAGRHQLILANNALHLTRENSPSHARAPPGTTTLFARTSRGNDNDPTPAQIDWMRLRATGRARLDLGCTTRSRTAPIAAGLGCGARSGGPLEDAGARSAPGGDPRTDATGFSRGSAVGLRGAGTAFYSSDNLHGVHVLRGRCVVHRAFRRAPCGPVHSDDGGLAPKQRRRRLRAGTLRLPRLPRRLQLRQPGRGRSPRVSSLASRSTCKRPCDHFLSAPPAAGR